MSEQAKIALSIAGNTFEISGPENFVSAQAAIFKEAITEALEKAATPPAEAPDEDESPDTAPPDTNTGKPMYTRVLHIDGETVKVLKAMPGTTKSKKAVATCIVYLWGKRHAGVEAVQTKELREVCSQHGCLDGPNFASHLKNAKEWIVVKDQKAQLSVPGAERAEKLLKEQNGDASAENP